MISLTATLCIAAVLLVIAGSLPAPATAKAWAGFIVFSGVVALAALGIRGWVSNGGFLSQTDSSARVRYALKQLAKAKERNILLVDGGSYAVRGVSDKGLTRELSKLGYSVRVVHLALDGANHFERGAMYSNIVKRLGSRVKPKKQRWTYLAEVHALYDTEPLSQFEANVNTPRVYDYATPSTLWDGWRAYSGEHVQQPPDRWNFRYELFSHLLVNVLNVGATSLLVDSDEIAPRSGFRGGQTLKRFRFRGLAPVLRAIKRPKPSKVPPWLFDIREPREQRIWSSYVDRWIYYGVPSTRRAQFNHVKAFCKLTDHTCVSPGDAKLIKRLNRRKYWLNSTHLSKLGARIYTKWLARRLHESGELLH